MTVTIDDVNAAAQRIRGAAEQTPFLHSQTLSQLTGAEVWLKFENLQFTASFKERGALNRLLQLSGTERERGVVAVSAGNHAEGIAYHARRLGVPATVVMPTGTPRTKVARTEGFDATVVLHGNSFAEAIEAVPDFVAKGLTFLHPFDDAPIMAGKGTVALEMLAQGPALDAMIVSVGGGGLIGGICAVLAARTPTTELIGVQSEVFPSMASALAAVPLAIPGGSSVAEGIAVARPGKLTLAQARATVGDVIVIPKPRSKMPSHCFCRSRRHCARGRAPPDSQHCRRSPNASMGGGWASSCAAATSTRACLSPSCSGTSPAPASSSGCA